jgi:hypothetical protein
VRDEVGEPDAEAAMPRALSMLVAVGLMVGFTIPFASTARADSGSPCPDLNGDGVVTVADIVIESTYLGQSVPPAPPQADMNKDGLVDDADLALFSPPLLSPPEWIATCQTSPIGPSGGPVGGIAAAPDVDSGQATGTSSVTALAAGFFAVLLGAAVAARLFGRAPA